VQAALDLINATPARDGAVLAINLNGEMVFPVAVILAPRGVPFVFATGYAADVPPEPFNWAPHFQKPVNAAMVADALDQTISAFLSPTQRRRREVCLAS
jgi:hypothetical protein